MLSRIGTRIRLASSLLRPSHIAPVNISSRCQATNDTKVPAALPKTKGFGADRRRRAEFAKHRSERILKAINIKKSRVVIPIAVPISVAQLAKHLNISTRAVAESLRDQDVPFTKCGRINDKTFLVKFGVDRNVTFTFETQIDSILTEKNPYTDLEPRAACTQTSLLKRRPPVVTIMGHVDHGKTTLLDALRDSNIVDSEFGGITQHIGAFSVKLKGVSKQDEKYSTITFLDTPGHAAFKNLRSRGAHLTDVVVLVVAAEDGAMPQTVESVKLAQSVDVPLIVALNKCDKASTQQKSRAIDSLLEHGIIPEQHGGNTQVVEISALKRQNLDSLQEAIILEASQRGCTADTSGPAEGFVIESTSEPNIGKVATVLVTRGILKPKASVICGEICCKVRQINDEHGVKVTQLMPGQAGRVTGWKESPNPGDRVLQGSDAQISEALKHRQFEARKNMALASAEKCGELRSASRQEYTKQREIMLSKGQYVFHKKSFLWESRNGYDESVNSLPTLSVLVRGDAEGSIEAILNVLESFHSEHARIDIASWATGPIAKADILRLSGFPSPVIYGFNVQTTPSDILELAKQHGVAIHHSNVIYRLVEDLRTRLTALLPSTTKQVINSEATVLKEFFISVSAKKKVRVIGLSCDSGKITKNCVYSIKRDEHTIVSNLMVSRIKHHKDDVESIKADQEAGILFDWDAEDVEYFSGADAVLKESDSTNPKPFFRQGDQLISYAAITVPGKLEWEPDF